MIIRPSMWTNHHLLNHILSLNINKIYNEWSVKMNCRKEEFLIPVIEIKELEIPIFLEFKKGKRSNDLK